MPPSGTRGDQVVLFIKSVFDNRGVRAAARSMDDLENRARSAGDAATGRFQKVGEALGFDSPRIQQLGEAVGLSKEMTATLGGLAIAATGASVAIGMTAVAVKKYYDLSKEGAGNRQLEESYDRFIRNVGASSETLSQMVANTNMTMSRMAAMEGTLTLVAGTTSSTGRAFAEAAPELAEVAKAANKLNPTLGDTNFMFNSLARGIKRSEVRLIDNLGLNVKVEAANRDYAASIGKTVEALTAEDKQLALLNETLRVGRLLIDQVGGSVESQVDKYIALSAAAADFRAEMSMTLGAKEFPGIGSLSNLMQDMTAEMRAGRIADIGIAAGVITQQEASLMLYNREYEKLKQIVEARQQMLDMYGEAGEKKAMQDLIDLAGQLGDSWERAAQQQRAAYSGGVDPFAEYRGNTFGSGLIYDTGDAMRKLGEVSEKHVAEGLKEAEDAAKDFREALVGMRRTVEDHNLDVAAANAEAYAKRVRETGDLLRQVSGDESLYTTSIDNLGDAYVRTGGRTAEQNELLEDLVKGTERAQGSIRDYQTGLKGFGQDQDKVNEKIAEQQALIGHLAPQIAELEGVQGDLNKTYVEAVWDNEKLEEALLNASAAAGIGASDYANLKVATGDWSDEQATAAIKAAAMADEINRIAAEGGPASEQLRKMQEAADRLSKVDLSTFFMPFEFGQGNEMPDFGEDDPMGLKKAEEDFVNNTAPNITKNWSAYVDSMRLELDEKLFIGAGQVAENTATLYVEPNEESILDAQNTIDELTKDRTTYIDIVMRGAGAPPQPSYNPLASSDTGGEVFAGMSYMVGGQGPELFQPLVNGNIVPNNKLSSGSTEEVHYHFYNQQAAAIGMAIRQESRLRRLGIR